MVKNSRSKPNWRPRGRARGEVDDLDALVAAAGEFIIRHPGTPPQVAGSRKGSNNSPPKSNGRPRGRPRKMVDIFGRDVGPAGRPAASGPPQPPTKPSGAGGRSGGSSRRRSKLRLPSPERRPEEGSPEECALAGLGAEGAPRLSGMLEGTGKHTDEAVGLAFLMNDVFNRPLGGGEWWPPVVHSTPDTTVFAVPPAQVTPSGGPHDVADEWTFPGVRVAAGRLYWFCTCSEALQRQGELIATARQSVMPQDCSNLARPCLCLRAIEVLADLNGSSSGDAACRVFPVHEPEDGVPKCTIVSKGDRFDEAGFVRLGAHRVACLKHTRPLDVAHVWRCTSQSCARHPHKCKHACALNGTATKATGGKDPEAFAREVDGFIDETSGERKLGRGSRRCSPTTRIPRSAAGRTATTTSRDSY